MNWSCFTGRKVADSDERLWYAHRAVEAGWIRNIFVHQIESGFYNRQGRALTNFANTMPTIDELERTLGDDDDET